MASPLPAGLASLAATVLEQVQRLRDDPTGWTILAFIALFIASLVYELTSRGRQWRWERAAWSRLGAALGLDEERRFDAPRDQGFRVVFDRVTNNDGVLPELTRCTRRTDIHVVAARRRTEYGARGLARPRTRYWTRIRLGPCGTIRDGVGCQLPRMSLRRAYGIERLLHGFGLDRSIPRTTHRVVVTTGDPAAFDALDHSTRDRLAATAACGTVHTGPEGITHTWVGPLPDPETVLERAHLLEPAAIPA